MRKCELVVFKYDPYRGLVFLKYGYIQVIQVFDNFSGDWEDVDYSHADLSSNYYIHLFYEKI